MGRSNQKSGFADEHYPCHCSENASLNNDQATSALTDSSACAEIQPQPSSNFGPQVPTTQASDALEASRPAAGLYLNLPLPPLPPLPPSPPSPASTISSIELILDTPPSLPPPPSSRQHLSPPAPYSRYGVVDISDSDSEEDSQRGQAPSSNRLGASIYTYSFASQSSDPHILPISTHGRLRRTANSNRLGSSRRG